MYDYKRKIIYVKSYFATSEYGDFQQLPVGPRQSIFFFLTFWPMKQQPFLRFAMRIFSYGAANLRINTENITAFNVNEQY
jgi:hypothetical protein